VPTADQPSAIERDEAPSDWKTIKSRIRERIPEIAFQNWFDETRQVERRGPELVVAVPDETTAAYIRTEYEHIVHAAAAAEGIIQVHLLSHGAAKAPVTGEIHDFFSITWDRTRQ
jgi:chromosomal replication initiation ATPase DnaA